MNHSPPAKSPAVVVSRMGCMTRIPAWRFLLVILLPSSLLADMVVFKNGDKLTGTIQTLDSGKLKIIGTLAGDVSVNLSDVATFSSTQPIVIETKSGQQIHQPISAAEDNAIRPATGPAIAIDSIKQLNPIPPKWTGSLLVNGTMARGNTNTDVLGITFNSEYRRHDDTYNDRTTLGADYNFGRQRDPSTGDTHTTTDNWMAQGKYDHFFTEKLYSYVDAKIEHDRIAELNYRLTPGVGLGYQWVEKPELNFRTEAGVTYVYEDYITDGHDDFAALRLAYHLDKKLAEKVKFFNDFEILPAFQDPSDYTLTADAGVRVDVAKNWFTEFKVEWARDNTPPPGADKNDFRYIVGVGYNF
jgi:putative salt-induced outer membrane protein YdiY